MRFNYYIAKIPKGFDPNFLRYLLKANLSPSCEVEQVHKKDLSPEFRTESPVTVRERLGSGGIPTAPPIPRKTEGRINVKGAD